MWPRVGFYPADEFVINHGISVWEGTFGINILWKIQNRALTIISNSNKKHTIFYIKYLGYLYAYDKVNVLSVNKLFNKT